MLFALEVSLFAFNLSLGFLGVAFFVVNPIILLVSLASGMVARSRIESNNKSQVRSNDGAKGCLIVFILTAIVILLLMYSLIIINGLH